jgi:hypothetical protein
VTVALIAALAALALLFLVLLILGLARSAAWGDHLHRPTEKKDED